MPFMTSAAFGGVAAASGAGAGAASATTAGIAAATAGFTAAGTATAGAGAAAIAGTAGSAAALGIAGGTAATTGISIANALAGLSVGATLLTTGLQAFKKPGSVDTPILPGVKELPQQDSEAILAAKRKNLIVQRARGGRASTMLSGSDDKDSLGG